MKEQEATGFQGFLTKGFSTPLRQAQDKLIEVTSIIYQKAALISPTPDAPKSYEQSGAFLYHPI